MSKLVRPDLNLEAPNERGDHSPPVCSSERVLQPDPGGRALARPVTLSAFEVGRVERSELSGKGERLSSVSVSSEYGIAREQRERRRSPRGCPWSTSLSSAVE